MKHFFRYVGVFFLLHGALLVIHWSVLPFPVPLLNDPFSYENTSYTVSLSGAFLQKASSTSLKIRCQSFEPRVQFRAKENMTLHIELFNIHPTHTLFSDLGWKKRNNPLRAEYTLSLQKGEEKTLTTQFQYPKNSEDFEFWVIGDLEDGYASVCSFRKEFQKKKPLFLLSIGDIVNNGTWFRYQMHQDFFDALEVPVFSVLGDGDIDDFPASKKLHLEKRMQLFHHFYGAPQFVLEIPQRLSILALNTVNTTSKSVDSFYQLSQQMTLTSQRLLVAHFPPIDPRCLVEADKKSIPSGDILNRYLKFVQEKSFSLGLYGQLHHFYDQFVEQHRVMVTSGMGARPFAEPRYDYFQVQVKQNVPLQVETVVFASGYFYKYANKYGFYWWSWWYLWGWERHWFLLHIFLLISVIAFSVYRKKRRI